MPKTTSNSFPLADLESNISVLESVLSSTISSEAEKNESCAFRWMKYVKPCLEDMEIEFFKPKSFKEGLDKLKEIHQSLKPNKTKLTLNFMKTNETEEDETTGNVSEDTKTDSAST